MRHMSNRAATALTSTSLFSQCATYISSRSLLARSLHNACFYMLCCSLLVRNKRMIIYAGHSRHIASACRDPINTVEIYREQYFVGTSASSLLLADLTAGLHSEIPWTYTGTERFLFDMPQVEALLVTTRPLWLGICIMLDTTTEKRWVCCI